MSKNKEIYNIGLKVDELQQIYYLNQDDKDIISIANFLGEYFDSSSDLEQDIKYQIVYYYTKSNFLTVLIEIAQKKYYVFQDKISLYSIFDSKDDLIFDFTIKRVAYLRKSVDIFNKNHDVDISDIWMAQVHVNLANLYLEMGRLVESIEELEDSKFILGMALGNYASKLYELSTFTLDESEQLEALICAKYYYNILLTKGEDDVWIPNDIFESFIRAERYVDTIIKENFREEKIYKDMEYEEVKEFNFKENLYRKWCRENQLILSINNIYQKKSLIDDIHLPNLGLGYFAEDNTLTYYSWFNTLKQEFNNARYSFYLAYSYDDISSVHESQEGIVLINTLDYPAIGYRTELLKNSLKVAYGVLDKIGMLCHSFIGGKNKLIKQVNFSSWYCGVEKQIALHSEFAGLYWMARDLGNKEGSYKIYRLLRNVIEHRYLRVLDNYNIPLIIELQDMNKMEYRITYQDLEEHTLMILKFIRAALFYVVFAFNSCYLATREACEKNHEVFLPLPLSYYEDEWKN